MREIKFRAWLEGKHESLTFNKSYMDYGCLIGVKGGWLDVESGWDIHGEYTTIPIMQFTGLRDRNGKEIYEGDIVKCEGITALVKYVVEPAIAGFVFDQDNCGAYREYAVDDHKKTIHYEVIGNIYENPELLTPSINI